MPEALCAKSGRTRSLSACELDLPAVGARRQHQRTQQVKSGEVNCAELQHAWPLPAYHEPIVSAAASIHARDRAATVGES